MASFCWQSNVIEKENSSPSWSLLEGNLDHDAMDVVLSYLTMAEYSNLSISSSTMRDRVSYTSHLHVPKHRSFGRTPNTRPEGDQKPVTPPTSSEMLIPFYTPHEKLQRLMNRFTNLSTLNLHSLEAVGDDIIDILNRCPSALTLKSVALENCALSCSCTNSFQLRNLESLTLTGNSIHSRMSLLLKNSSNLKSLTFQQCPSLRDKDIEGLSQTLPNLESLVMNHTNTSKPVASFLRLIHASFLGEYHLASLSKFNCPSLKVLNLSFCVRLSENQIEKIVKDSPALETLILMKCSGVHSLDLDSKKLRNLDISFTHNLSTLRLKCPALENLDVSGFHA